VHRSRFLHAAKALEAHGAIEVEWRVLGSRANRLAELNGRAVCAAEVQEDRAVVLANQGVVGAKVRGEGIFAKSADGVAILEEHVSVVHVSEDESEIDLKGSLECLLGFVVVPTHQ